MKLSSSDISAIRTALSVGRIIELQLAVLANGKIMGINDKGDAAIISALTISAPNLVFGIGRADELTKRLALFNEGVEAELKVNHRNEVTQLTFIDGRAKMQFRCTSMALLERKYPQENADTAALRLVISKEEISQLTRAAKVIGAENIVIKVEQTGEVSATASDSNSDRFTMQLDRAKFIGSSEPVAFAYRADVLTSVMAEAGRDTDIFVMTVGEGGSLTATVRNHTLIIMPQANGE